MDIAKYWNLKSEREGDLSASPLMSLKFQIFQKDRLLKLVADLKKLTPEEVRDSEYLIANIWSMPMMMWRSLTHFNTPGHPASGDYWDIMFALQREVYRLLGTPDLGGSSD